MLLSSLLEFNNPKISKLLIAYMESRATSEYSLYLFQRKCLMKQVSH